MPEKRRKSAVTIQEVAARAKVSAMTVSRVTNSPERVAPATRQRVEQAIAELGYVPNALASGLLHGRTRTIALIVSDISNPFFTMLLRGVEDLAQVNGYTVIIGNSDESVEKEQQYVHALIGKRIDGLLIAPAGSGSLETLKLLQRRNSPFVLIDREIESIQADVVMGDSVEGARLLTEHLISLGHRRIALVNGSYDVPTARERLAGYRIALEAHNIPFEAELAKECSYRRGPAQIAMNELLALPADLRPSAVVASNNLICIGVIEALRQARLRIPEDMAVVCFDDIELASAIDPFLTVLAQPARRFGTIAAQFLIERIDRSAPAPARRVVLPSELVVRRSCGSELAR
jgi:LacI family transcriptional regulator